MKKTLAAAFLFAFGLTACGGGGSDGGSTAPTAKALKISMYGKPIVSSPSSAVAHAQFNLISAAVAAEAPGVTSGAQATIKSLTDALAARGVTSDITPQVMDGTTLHQIVTTEHNGVAPTADQFKTDPSEWMIVNFQLDDMVTAASDPAQQAAAKQFADDLLIFSQWAAVNGKSVWVVTPIFTCDRPDSAAAGLDWGIHTAFSNGAPIRFIGQTVLSVGWDAYGKPRAPEGQDLSHLGADCRTPDAYLQNAVVDAIADTIALAYKETGAAAPASGSSATQ